MSKLDDIQAIVNQQAEDGGLWFEAITALEAYLQQELRRLHAAIDASGEVCSCEEWITGAVLKKDGHKLMAENPRFCCWCGRKARTA